MTAAHDVRTVMVFAVGQRRFALPGAQVLEIARVGTLTVVPSDDPANLGLVLHRDRIIPVVDVARRLGVPVGPREPGQLTLFARAAFGEVGFPIDAVVGFGSASAGAPADGATFVDLDELWKRHAANPAD